MDAFRQGNAPKAFRASPSPVDDLEWGAGVVQEREGSTHALTEASSWDMTKRSMTDVSIDELRRSHVSSGVTVVQAEM